MSVVTVVDFREIKQTSLYRLSAPCSQYKYKYFSDKKRKKKKTEQGKKQRPENEK